ncbi:MAG: hypothetical protein AAF567_04890 [Actinomycetota bacterium]
MAHIFGRLLPSVREVRNPLAVGSTWFIVIWSISLLNGGDDTDVGRFLRSLASDLSPIASAAAIAFAAALFGSGILRLMDRIMQLMQGHRASYGFNPLDRPDSFRTRGGAEFTGVLEEYVLDRKNELPRWTFPEDDEVLEDDLTIFRRYLADDLEFGGLQSEQLLRFALLPPVILGAAAATVWAFQGDASTWWLAAAMWLFVLILGFDYRRTGTLLNRRWTRLVSEYPQWLSADATAVRASVLEALAARPIVTHLDGGTVIVNSGPADAHHLTLRYEGSLPDSPMVAAATSSDEHAVGFLEAGDSVLVSHDLTILHGALIWRDGRGWQKSELQPEASAQGEVANE